MTADQSVNYHRSAEVAGVPDPGRAHAAEHEAAGQHIAASAVPVILVNAEQANTTDAVQSAAYSTLLIPASSGPNPSVIPVLPPDTLRQYAYLIPLDVPVVAATSLSEAQAAANIGSSQQTVSTPQLGFQTDPAAGTVLATATLPAGIWTVAATVVLGGTPTAADAGNVGIYEGATLVAQPSYSDAVEATQNLAPQTLVLAVPTVVSLKTVGAGSGAANYMASYAATPQLAAATVPDSGAVLPVGSAIPIRHKSAVWCANTSPLLAARVAVMVERSLPA